MGRTAGTCGDGPKSPSLRSWELLSAAGWIAASKVSFECSAGRKARVRRPFEGASVPIARSAASVESSNEPFERSKGSIEHSKESNEHSGEPIEHSKRCTVESATAFTALRKPTHVRIYELRSYSAVNGHGRRPKFFFYFA